MLVIRKENDDTLNRQKTKNEEHNYNLMLYVLKNFSDMSVDDQLVIFNKMTFIRLFKSNFIALREKVLADYSGNINQESITITDLKADYHINNGMLEMQIDSLDEMKRQLDYYIDLFEQEKNKVHPDIDNLVKITLLIERIVNRIAVLNNGTAIILFFRFQSKKQKMEIQQIKEKYQQQLLLLKKEFEEKKAALELKNKDPAEQKSISKTDIADQDNVTNPDIDELEHHAKLKDSGNRTIRSNVNRSDNKQNLKDERVQSDTSSSSTTGTASEDRISEVSGESEERRSKEAVF